MCGVVYAVITVGAIYDTNVRVVAKMIRVMLISTRPNQGSTARLAMRRIDEVPWQQDTAVDAKISIK